MRVSKVCLVWAGYTLLWTAALIMPAAATHVGPFEELSSGYRLFLAKSLHVGAYAVMTLLTAWLPVSARYRWLLMFFLMGHATVTELIQDAFPVLGRTGHLYDVAFDHLGIVLGSAASWKLWCRPGP